MMNNKPLNPFEMLVENTMIATAKNFFKEKGRVSTHIVSLKHVYDSIISDKFKDLCLQIRSCTDKKSSNLIKKKLGAIIPNSNHCGKNIAKDFHNEAHLNKIIVLDIDEFHENADREYVLKVLTNIPHISLIFTSPSGIGIKAFYHFDHPISSPKDYNRIWKIIFSEFERLNIHLDRSCSDIYRICYLSYDPNAILKNAYPRTFDIPKDRPVEKKVTVRKALNYNRNFSDRENVLEQLRLLTSDIHSNPDKYQERYRYDERLIIISALANSFGDDEEIFNRIPHNPTATSKQGYYFYKALVNNPNNYVSMRKFFEITNSILGNYK